jgi:ribonuclease BN (tRNA processing enzyme)
MERLMRLTILGSSGSSPGRDNPASGYLVEHGTTRMMLDAGPGTFARLAAERDPASLDALVISHVHVDHCSDLMAFYAYLSYGPGRGRQPLPVFVPQGAADYFATVARAGEDDPFWSVFDLRTVGEGDVAEIGSLGLAFAAAYHSVPTLCARVEAGGHSLVYSGDTGRGGGLPGLVQGADVLLCEATYQEARRDLNFPFHLSAAEAAAIAATAGVRVLVLTHLPPTLDPGRSVTEASAEFSGEIHVARPGLTIDVGT